MISMEETIVKLQDELKKAHKDIVNINDTLKVEREVLKDTNRKLTSLKEAYEMQIDLREALERKIDKLVYGND